MSNYAVEVPSIVGLPIVGVINYFRFDACIAWGVIMQSMQKKWGSLVVKIRFFSVSRQMR